MGITMQIFNQSNQLYIVNRWAVVSIVISPHSSVNIQCNGALHCMCVEPPIDSQCINDGRPMTVMNAKG
jgi:hypothetical protein